MYFYSCPGHPSFPTPPVPFTSIIEVSHKWKLKYVEGLVSLPRFLMLFSSCQFKFSNCWILGHHISPIVLLCLQPLPYQRQKHHQLILFGHHIRHHLILVQFCIYVLVRLSFEIGPDITCMVYDICYCLHAELVKCRLQSSSCPEPNRSTCGSPMFLCSTNQIC